jgi:hypothetical protein
MGPIHWPARRSSEKPVVQNPISLQYYPGTVFEQTQRSMTLPIVKYGHPVLRQKGARIDLITPAIRQLIDDMIETMSAAAGVGLAAQ